MFGYVVCNKCGLEPEELARYQSVYCGLCRALGRKFGQTARMGLNYDLTFLALLLSSLYEPHEETKKFKCAAHPIHSRTAVGNPYIDYAADMTVVLIYYKCLDDWQDEHKLSSRRMARRLEKSYREMQKRYPRQCRVISESIQAISELEQRPDTQPDDIINWSGRMLSELFVYKEDFWSNSLRAFGYELGRFIYLMDAAMDYKKDIKKGNYNPLRRMKKRPEEMEDILKTVIGNATHEFEKLPLVQDVHLMRNILYGGVWQKYYAKMHGKEKYNGRRSV